MSIRVGYAHVRITQLPFAQLNARKLGLRVDAKALYRSYEWPKYTTADSRNRLARSPLNAREALFSCFRFPQTPLVKSGERVCLSAYLFSE
jgi:hypothetical protein